jgi:hypothetical protein
MYVVPRREELMQIDELVRWILLFLAQGGYVIWVTFVRSVIVTCSWRQLVPQQSLVHAWNWGSNLTPVCM